MRNTYHGWKKYEDIPDNEERPSSSLPSSLSLTCKNNHDYYNHHHGNHDMMNMMTRVTIVE